MRWVLTRGGGLLVVLLAVFGLIVHGAEHDPNLWHVDPREAPRTGQPNDYLVGPEDSTAAQRDRDLTGAPPTPLARFDRVAQQSPRVDVVAGSVDEGFITYVQRSALMGFPDYISVIAVAGPAGPSIVVWSRSRYGYSDLGVNASRVEEWLAEAGFG
ncbi:MAG: DUF1499 domain-containing protein [Pseudomonadota bacterium]